MRNFCFPVMKSTWKLIFSDNIDLGADKIDIHFAENEHSHEKSTNPLQNEHIKPKGSFPAKNIMLVNLHILIPDNVTEGKYLFGIYATDKTGNQNVF